MNYIKRKLKKDGTTLVFHMELDKDHPSYKKNISKFMCPQNNKLKMNIIVRDEILDRNLFHIEYNGCLLIVRWESDLVGSEEAQKFTFIIYEDKSVLGYDLVPILDIMVSQSQMYNFYKDIEILVENFDVVGRKVKYIIEAELDVFLPSHPLLIPLSDFINPDVMLLQNPKEYQTDDGN